MLWQLLILGSPKLLISALTKPGLRSRNPLRVTHGVPGQAPSATTQARSFSCIFMVFAIVPV